MNKPQKYLPKQEWKYNLIDVLKYIDESVPRFKRKVWRVLCDLGYIQNDTCQYISFKEIFPYTDDDVLDKGLRLLYDEFPDIESGDVLFDISW